MPTNQAAPKGINRSYDASNQQKWVFILLHLLIVLSCIWLIYYHGWITIGNFFGQHWQLADPTRATILLACAMLYWLRHMLTLLFLLARKINWSEVFGLVLFFASFEIGLILLGGGAFRDYPIHLGWLDSLALLLLSLGSLVNSFSELQRKRWKSIRHNHGRCYTGGLFRHAMHINYFGDVILFIGWCLFTHNLWSLTLVLLMVYSFVGVHIPGLDEHLTQRYGKDFEIYAAKTKRLVPFIY